MTMVFTRHAVDRYVQFHMLDRPSVTKEEAARLLAEHADGARRVSRTMRGDPVWAIDALGIEVVAKHEDGIDVCVTVLPPPRFRGLTPLQAEVVAASHAAAAVAVHVLEVARAAIPPQPKTTPATLVARREAQERATNRNLINKHYKHYIHAVTERDILAGVLKTMRVQLSRDANLTTLKSGLRIALRYIRTRTLHDSDAVEAIEQIGALDPKLTANDFIDGESP